MGSPHAGRTTSRGSRSYLRRARLAGVSVAGAALALVAGLVAPGRQRAGVGTRRARGERDLERAECQGFADSLGSGSKVWYTIGQRRAGERRSIRKPTRRTRSACSTSSPTARHSPRPETTGTSHAISLADPTSLVWQQVNTADNGDFTITKTYIADPSRSVMLVQTTFDNPAPSRSSSTSTTSRSSTTTGWATPAAPIRPAATWWPPTARCPARWPPPPASARPTTGYVGTSSDGRRMLTSSHALTSTYSSASTAGHIVQVAQIPVAASGSTTFTLALAFDSTAGSRDIRRRRVAGRPDSPRWRARSSPAGSPGWAG